ncbi:hypothetical protein [Nocardia terpenica]|uniref:hypothetical protein n=1 Tax=Nocardia terpenica TaxID=455432 RepID=UPI000B1CF79D|nr:hypothetical protein [Nocardia terpenica]NQE85980.1 hypothetical protein [Nocardia terpenica]
MSEQTLTTQWQLIEDHERSLRQRPTRLSAAELAVIGAVADDIPALWSAPTTTVGDRKKLIRAAIDKVTVTPAGAMHTTIC